MFKDHLQKIVDGTEGALAAILMGFDGISIDEYRAADSDLNAGDMAIEFSALFSKVNEVLIPLNKGNLIEFTIKAEGLFTLIRVVNEDYFLILFMNTDGNFGKGRYLLRINAHHILKEL